jgi:uroporphyrinogen decarboxylase
MSDKNEQPEFSNLLSVLKGEKPSRPTLFEFFMNMPFYKRFCGDLPSDCPEHLLDLVTTIYAYKNLGYDYAPTRVPGFLFEVEEREHKESVSMSCGLGISDAESCSAYPWPDPAGAAYRILDEVAPFVPEGMKLIVLGPGGVLENVTSLVGYENMCFMLIEDEMLAQEVFSQVGSRLYKYYKNALQHDAVGAVIANDDWGFRSQTLLSPEHLRRFVFPWHSKIVEAAHSAGRPAILHSCGQLKEVWEDIIETLGYDGKHSYEDAILPVEEAYEIYQGRIGILGGIDLDYVCRETPDAVYRRCREMIDRTSERGGYALGTGNSISEYAPDAQVLAMIRAVHDAREEM